jgi:glutamyl-tRNA reductase
MENNNLSKHVYFIPLDWLKKADAEIRGRFSLDTLAKTRLLEQEERGDWKFNRNHYLQSNWNLWICRAPFQLIKDLWKQQR